MSFDAMETTRRAIIALRFFIFREKTLKRRKRSISRGGMLGDGVQMERVNYKYSCMPVAVGELNRKDYIVCVALEKGDTEASFKSLFIGQYLRSVNRIMIVIW